jgi:hypothetical protein
VTTTRTTCAGNKRQTRNRQAGPFLCYWVRPCCSCQDAMRCAVNRMDPFWGGLWVGGRCRQGENPLPSTVGDPIKCHPHGSVKDLESPQPSDASLLPEQTTTPVPWRIDFIDYCIKVAASGSEHIDLSSGCDMMPRPGQQVHGTISPGIRPKPLNPSPHLEFPLELLNDTQVDERLKALSNADSRLVKRTRFSSLARLRSWSSRSSM